MHPDNFRTIRHGTAVGEIAEEHSVPEGKAKSEQALVRRPPYARRATAPERARRLFLLHRARRVLFLAQPKREWGAHCPAGTPAESPGRLITAPTVLQGSGGNPAGGHTVPPLPLPADQLIQRQAVEIRQGNQCGQGRFPQTQLIVLIGAPTDSNFHRKSLLTQVSCCSQLKKMFRKCHGHPLFS